MSKHVITAKDSCLALVNVAVEGFIWKPPPAGTQPVDLPTFKDPQLVAEEILSSDDEADTQSKENKKIFRGKALRALSMMRILRSFTVQMRLKVNHSSC